MASLSEQLSSPLVRAFLITGISGIIAGFFIGKTVGSSTSATSFASGADDSDLSANEDDDELSKSAFNTGEECKLVLVVRTDLGMTKGTFTSNETVQHNNNYLQRCCTLRLSLTLCAHYRQDRSTMLTRHARLLQSTQTIARKVITADSSAMGALRPGQGCGKGRQRRGIGDAAGTGGELESDR